MIRFELLKIFRSRINKIAMLLGLVLLVAVYISQNFGSESVYCEEIDNYLYRLEAINYYKARAAAMGDTLTEEVITDYLKKVQAFPGDLNSDDAYTDLIRQNSSLFYYMCNSYKEIGDMNYDNNLLKDLDLSKGAGFYDYRMEKIRSYLNMDFSYGNYTEAEKEFWLNKASHVKTPFAWGSRELASRMEDMMSVPFFLLAIVIECVAPIFSKESDTGAVQLLLTTRYGKTRLIQAKIAASIIFTVSYLGICGLIGGIACGITNGWAEQRLPVQLWGNAIPYDLTIGESSLLHLGLVILIGITLTAVLLFTSALTKNGIGAMAVALLLLLGPIFLPYSRESGLINHLLDLTFFRFANMSELLIRFTSYRLGPIILDQITMSALTWTLITVILLLPLRSIFISRNIRH